MALPTHSGKRPELCRRIASLALLPALLCTPSKAQTTPPAALHFTLADTGKPISPDLFGIFFEDLSYAADGGLYGELIQNRSFEYTPVDRKEWNALTAWKLDVAAGAKAGIHAATEAPLNPDNKHYAVLDVAAATPTQPVTLENSGFDGIAVKAGEPFHLALFTRQLAGASGTLTVQLQAPDGRALATAQLPRAATSWQRLTADLTASATEPNAHFALTVSAPGSLALDVVSLFPVHTFHDRPNGLRADLAQTLADLHPHFIRFPGGCLVHGDGLANTYRWQDTIGPIEQRIEQPNIWSYHQSVGLGYFEYFQFAEDIGAKPLPVVSAGVSCQNSGARVTHVYGVGQQALPLTQMDAYVQDVLNLVEYANGPATSPWGAKRAAAGHPKPFGLQYIGVGNEDAQTQDFRDRFTLIADALRKTHPEITVIGTVGPAPAGQDYEAGWKFASALHVPMVDEHMYEHPAWFFEHLHRYDSYDRNGPGVYIGEYAAQDSKLRSTLRAALAEAAFMTSLERNGDIVRMASYAPLLSKDGHASWNPNLITFGNTSIRPSVSFYVQQLFAANSGSTYLTAKLDAGPAPPSDFALSSVTTGRSLILKIVNAGDLPTPIVLDLPEAYRQATHAAVTSLAGDLDGTDGPGPTATLLPIRSNLAIAGPLRYQAPAHSLTVLRIER